MAFLISVAASTLMSGSSTRAEIQDSYFESSFNEPCYVEGHFAWSPPRGEGDGDGIPPPNGPWTVTVDEYPVVLDPTSDPVGYRIEAVIAHNPGQPICDDLHGTNPASIFLHAQLPLTGGRQAAAAIIRHGNHVDSGLLKITLNSISVEAHHDNTIRNTQASATNLTEGPLFVRVTPDYRHGGELDREFLRGDPYEFNLGSGEHERFSLHATDGDGGVLASLHNLTIGSPATETYAAFLGELDGAFTQLDLAIGTELLVGLSQEFTYPLLAHETENLYVAVDLTQWLSFPTPYVGLDTFSFTNGRSDDLPGYLVATAPITLGPGGFESSELFDGETHVVGEGDAMISPEPSSLICLAWCVVAAGRWKRKDSYYRS